MDESHIPFFNVLINLISPRCIESVQISYLDNYVIWTRFQGLVKIASCKVWSRFECFGKSIFHWNFCQVFRLHNISCTLAKIENFVLIFPFGALDHIIKCKCGTFVTIFDSIDLVTILGFFLPDLFIYRGSHTHHDGVTNEYDSLFTLWFCWQLIEFLAKITMYLGIIWTNLASMRKNVMIILVQPI